MQRRLPTHIFSLILASPGTLFLKISAGPLSYFIQVSEHIIAPTLSP